MVFQIDFEIGINSAKKTDITFIIITVALVLIGVDPKIGRGG